MRVAVTGCNGFIGNALCELLDSNGHEVIGISRRRGTNAVGKVVAMDITSNGCAAALSSAISNCDAVVHTVGLAHNSSIETAAEGEFRQINVGSSITIAEACVREGVGTFIYLSSIKAVAENSELDEQGQLQKITDFTEPRPQDDYGRSKLEAENAICRAFDKTSTKVVILRPPLVYGVGQKGNMARLFNLVDRRLPIPFPRTNNTRSLISINNLCDAILAVLLYPDKRCGRYLIADVDLSTSELLSAVAKVLKRKVISIPISLTVLKILARLLNKEVQLEKISGSLVVDDSKFRRDFMWQPRFGFTDVITRIAEERID